MSQRVLIIFCGLLMTMSAFSTDVILPAFDAMRVGLSVDLTMVQWTVPIYLIGLGFGQLIFGPMSDSLGRKRAIYVGFATYIAGLVVALVTGVIEGVLFGRFLQGLGGGAGQVIGRAIIRDCFAGKELARNMALGMAIFAIGPIVAPFLGYALTLIGPWQIVFAAMLLFGVMLWLFALRVPETNSTLRPDAMQPKQLLANARRVLGNSQSRFFALLSAFVSIGLFTYLTIVPRIFSEQLGQSTFAFTAYFALSGIGIIVGQIVNRRLIQSRGVLTSTVVGTGVLCISTLLLALVSWLGWMSAPILCVLMLCYNTSYLVIVANCASLSLDPHGEIAGFTAAFLGFVNSVLASVFAALVVWLTDGDLQWWSLVMVLIATIALLALFYKRRVLNHAAAAA